MCSAKFACLAATALACAGVSYHALCCTGIRSLQHWVCVSHTPGVYHTHTCMQHKKNRNTSHVCATRAAATTMCYDMLCRVLLCCPFKVERLGIGDDATVLLARHLTGLLQLSLSGNNIGPAGAAGIAQHLTGLEALDLSVNRWVNDSCRWNAGECLGAQRLQGLGFQPYPGCI